LPEERTLSVGTSPLAPTASTSLKTRQNIRTWSLSGIFRFKASFLKNNSGQAAASRAPSQFSTVHCCSLSGARSVRRTYSLKDFYKHGRTYSKRPHLLFQRRQGAQDSFISKQRQLSPRKREHQHHLLDDIQETDEHDKRHELLPPESGEPSQLAQYSGESFANKETPLSSTEQSSTSSRAQPVLSTALPSNPFQFAYTSSLHLPLPNQDIQNSDKCPGDDELLLKTDASRPPSARYNFKNRVKGDEQPELDRLKEADEREEHEYKEPENMKSSDNIAEKLKDRHDSQQPRTGLDRDKEAEPNNKGTEKIETRPTTPPSSTFSENISLLPSPALSMLSFNSRLAYKMKISCRKVRAKAHGLWQVGSMKMRIA
jgi:hypothetical protein